MVNMSIYILYCYEKCYVHDTQLLFWITANVTDLVYNIDFHFCPDFFLAELDITGEVIVAIS